MTPEQTAVAIPILNSYAHQYLGLNVGDVVVGGGLTDDGNGVLIVAIVGQETLGAHDFDAAKAAIDAFAASR